MQIIVIIISQVVKATIKYKKSVSETIDTTILMYYH